MPAYATERSVDTQEALQHLENPRAALELTYPGERGAYYITKQRGNYYLTTSYAQNRNLSKIMPRKEATRLIQRAFAERLQLREAPFGELVDHCP